MSYHKDTQAPAVPAVPTQDVEAKIASNTWDSFGDKYLDSGKLYVAKFNAAVKRASMDLSKALVEIRR